MPATAGRVRMPPNNRVHSSVALQTHGIWQSTIGYDPYAPQPNLSNSKPDAENAYASYQGLLQLARITGPNSDEVRGTCKRCGRVGHLTYQCRNFLSVKDKEKEDLESIQADVASELGKLKGKLGKAKGKDDVKADSEEEDEDIESSDSDYDSDMERLIAQRYGQKSFRKEKLKKKNKDSDVDGSDTDSGERKKRGRSKKRRSRKRKHDDSDDSERDRKKRRKEKRRKRDESSDEDDKRRRRHRKSSK